MILFSQLPAIIQGKDLQTIQDQEIHYLITDSRKAVASDKSLFFAIRGVRNDGHDYIESLYRLGVRSFIVEREVDIKNFPLGNFIRVTSCISALQRIAAHHRKAFPYPVIGITGSNGKTTVKEWLYQMVAPEYKCIKNPGSYNSQLGVPLSVWQMNTQHNLAIFEAGISKPDEMGQLQPIIQPTIGLFTNVGSAHDEGFSSREEKVKEKLKLFEGCNTLIYCSDYPEIGTAIHTMIKPPQNVLSWGQKSGSNILLEFTNDNSVSISGSFGSLMLRIPFENKASKENILHVVVVLLQLGYTPATIQEKIDQIRSIPMRLELKHGINHCQVVDDTYNNDLGGLQIGLDFLGSINLKKRTVILSDILQSGLTLQQLSERVAQWIREKSIQKFIGIGFGFHTHQQPFAALDCESNFYLTTDDFLNETDWNRFNQEAILVKGARVFEFEKIIQRLQQKIHGTVMEIDLGAMVHNLNFFRSLLNPNVKLMVMVKAFAYGSGSNEIASLLQYHHVDYLGVAYADEGVSLRDHHIKLPIMVMNPSEESFAILLERDLEPEVYNLRMLQSLSKFLNGRPCRIHLKIDTGMRRLGFEPRELDQVISILHENKNIAVASVFSHLAGADEAVFDDFTREQTSQFESATEILRQKLRISPIRHLLNSSGILRHSRCQFDMVRLGIGLYGIDPSGMLQDKLKPVATLKTLISQLKKVKKGDSIGYGRAGMAKSSITIATLAIGYADGYLRSFSKGVGEVIIRGRRAPVIGNVCMDMTMVDVTEIEDVGEGDEAIIFGEGMPIQELAKKAGTIPYEILTNTSERVKRIFYAESI